MMTRHKQCTGAANGESSVTKMACAALRDRLRNVVQVLARTVKSKCDCVEDTHALRVATRRADAALRMFGDWLPRRRQRLMRDTLRKIRANAGAVRDLDVLRERLQSAAGSPSLRSSRWLLEHLDVRRRSGRKAMLKWRRISFRDRLRDQIRRLVRSLRWRGTGDEPTSARLVSNAIPLLTARFESAWKTLDASPNRCHRARIRARRVRYTLEVMDSFFLPGTLKVICEQLSQVQDELGRVNDDVTALRHLRDWLSECHDATVRPTLHVMIVRAESAVTERIAALEEDGGLRHRAKELMARLHDLKPVIDGS